MKFLNILKLAFVAVLFASLYSCDVIDKPFEESVTPVDTSSTTTHVRKILLEEYTGFQCPNCPSAIPVIEALKAIYSDRLVVMAVHAGYFAKPDASTGHYIYDFRTSVGTDWYREFGIESNPMGLINRIGKTTSQHIFAPGSWAEQIATVAEDNEPEMLINIMPSYTDGAASIGAKVDVEFLQNLEKRYMLSVVLIQDGIIDVQNNGGTVVEGYEHNHVLRGAFNSSWGEAVNSENVSKGEKYSTDLSIAVKDDATHPWEADKLKIIAFVYDADTYEVMQVEEVSVK